LSASLRLLDPLRIIHEASCRYGEIVGKALPSRGQLGAFEKE
jgi:hypothetical protein